jgi:hypothetical protein
MDVPVFEPTPAATGEASDSADDDPQRVDPMGLDG